jgi:hypothetical protein
MKITEALLDKNNRLRISDGYRWLVGNNDGDGWIVYEHLPYARKSTIVCETTDEDVAVDALLNNEDEE